MRATDPEHIAFARPTESLFNIANTVDGITGNPLEGYRRGYRACDHSCRNFGLVAKPTSAGT